MKLIFIRKSMILSLLALLAIFNFANTDFSITADSGTGFSDADGSVFVPDGGGGGSVPDDAEEGEKYIQDFYLMTDACSTSSGSSSDAKLDGDDAPCLLWTGENPNENLISSSGEDFEYRSTGSIRYDYDLYRWQSELELQNHYDSTWFETNEDQLHFNDNATPVLPNESPSFLYQINEGNERFYHSVFQYVPDWVRTGSDDVYRSSGNYEFRSHDSSGERIEEQYLRLNEEEYNRYNQVNFVPEFVETDDYYWGDVSYLYEFENDFRYTQNQRTVYLLQHEVQNYTQKDVNGRTSSSSSFIDSNYFSDGKYYVYDNSEDLFFIYDYKTEGNSGQWVDINDPETQNLSGQTRLVTLNENGETVERIQQQHEQLIRRDYYEVTGQTWLTYGDSNETDYFKNPTGNFRYYNTFERTRPVYEGGHEPTPYTQEYYAIGSEPQDQEGGDAYERTNDLKYTNYFDIYETSTSTERYTELGDSGMSFDSEKVIDGKYAERTNIQTAYMYNRHRITLDTNNYTSQSSTTIERDYGNDPSPTSLQSPSGYGDTTRHYQNKNASEWTYIRYDRNPVPGSYTHGSSYSSWTETDPRDSAYSHTSSNGTTYYSNSGDPLSGSPFTVQSQTGDRLLHRVQRSVGELQVEREYYTYTENHGDEQISASSLSSTQTDGFSSGGKDYEVNYYANRRQEQRFDRVSFVDGQEYTNSSWDGYTSVLGHSYLQRTINGTQYFDLIGEGRPSTRTEEETEGKRYQRARQVSITFTWEQKGSGQSWYWRGEEKELFYRRLSTDGYLFNQISYTSGNFNSSGASSLSRWTNFSRHWYSGNERESVRLRDELEDYIGTRWLDYTAWRDAMVAQSSTTQSGENYDFRNFEVTISRQNRTISPNSSDGYEDVRTTTRSPIGWTYTRDYAYRRDEEVVGTTEVFDGTHYYFTKRSSLTDDTLSQSHTFYTSDDARGDDYRGSYYATWNTTTEYVSFSVTEEKQGYTEDRWVDWGSYSNHTSRNEYLYPDGSWDSGGRPSLPTSDDPSRSELDNYDEGDYFYQYRRSGPWTYTGKTYYRERSGSISTSYETDYSSYRWVQYDSSTRARTTTSYRYVRGDNVTSTRHNGTGFKSFNTSNGVSAYEWDRVDTTWQETNTSVNTNYIRSTSTPSDSCSSQSLSNGETSCTYYTQGDRNNRYTYTLHDRVKTGTVSESNLEGSIDNKTETYSNGTMMTWDPMNDKDSTRYQFSHSERTHWLYNVFEWDGEQEVVGREGTGETTTYLASENESSVEGPSDLAWYDPDNVSDSFYLSRNDRWELVNRELEREFDIYEKTGYQTIRTEDYILDDLVDENYIRPSASTISSNSKNLFDIFKWERTIGSPQIDSRYTSVSYESDGASIENNGGNLTVSFNSGNQATTSRNSTPMFDIGSSTNHTVSVSGNGNNSANWEVVNSSGSVIASGDFGSNTSETFSTPSDNQIGIRMTGTGSDLNINWVQVEEGSEATIYQPHSNSINRDQYTLHVVDDNYRHEKKQFIYEEAEIWEDTNLQYTYEEPTAYWDNDGVQYDEPVNYPYNIDGGLPYDQLITRNGSYTSSGTELYTPSNLSPGYRYRRVEDSDGSPAVEREYRRYSVNIVDEYASTNSVGNPNDHTYYDQNDISNFSDTSGFEQNLSIQTSNGSTQTAVIDASWHGDVDGSNSYIHDTNSGSLMKRSNNVVYYALGLYADEGSYTRKVDNFDYMQSVNNLYTSQNYITDRDIVSVDNDRFILTGEGADKFISTSDFLTDEVSGYIAEDSPYEYEVSRSDFEIRKESGAPTYNRYDVYADTGEWVEETNLSDAYISEEIQGELSETGFLENEPSVYVYENNGIYIHIWSFNRGGANSKLSDIVFNNSEYGSESDFEYIEAIRYNTLTSNDFISYDSSGREIYSNDMDSGNYLMLQGENMQEEYILQEESASYSLRGYTNYESLSEITDISSSFVDIEFDNDEAYIPNYIDSFDNQTKTNPYATFEPASMTQKAFASLMSPSSSVLRFNGLPNTVAKNVSTSQTRVSGSFYNTDETTEMFEGTRLYGGGQKSSGIPLHVLTGGTVTNDTEIIPEFLMLYDGITDYKYSEITENFGSFSTPENQETGKSKIVYAGAYRSGYEMGDEYALEKSPEYEIYALHTIRNTQTQENIRYDVMMEERARIYASMFRLAYDELDIEFEDFVEKITSEYLVYRSGILYLGEDANGVNMTPSEIANNSRHISEEDVIRHDEQSNFSSADFRSIADSQYISFTFDLSSPPHGGGDPFFIMNISNFGHQSYDRIESEHLIENSDGSFSSESNWLLNNLNSITFDEDGFVHNDLNGTMIDNVRDSWAQDNNDNEQSKVHVVEKGEYQFIYLRQSNVDHITTGDFLIDPDHDTSGAIEDHYQDSDSNRISLRMGISAYIPISTQPEKRQIHHLLWNEHAFFFPYADGGGNLEKVTMRRVIYNLNHYSMNHGYQYAPMTMDSSDTTIDDDYSGRNQYIENLETHTGMNYFDYLGRGFSDTDISDSGFFGSIWGGDSIDSRPGHFVGPTPWTMTGISAWTHTGLFNEGTWVTESVTMAQTGRVPDDPSNTFLHSRFNNTGLHTKGVEDGYDYSSQLIEFLEGETYKDQPLYSGSSLTGRMIPFREKTDVNVKGLGGSWNWSLEDYNFTSDYLVSSNFDSPATYAEVYENYIVESDHNSEIEINSKLEDTDYRYNFNDMNHRIKLKEYQFGDFALNPNLMESIFVEITSDEENSEHFTEVSDGIRLFNGDIEVSADMNNLENIKSMRSVPTIFNNAESSLNTIGGLISSVSYEDEENYEDYMDQHPLEIPRSSEGSELFGIPLDYTDSRGPIPINLTPKGLINYDEKTFIHSLEMEEHTLYNFNMSIPKFRIGNDGIDDYFEAIDNDFEGTSPASYRYQTNNYSIIARDEDEKLSIIFAIALQEVSEYLEEFFLNEYEFEGGLEKQYDHTNVPHMTEEAEKSFDYIEELVEIMAVSSFQTVSNVQSTRALPEGVQMNFHDLPASSSINFDIYGVGANDERFDFDSHTIETGEDMVMNPYGDTLQSGNNVFSFNAFVEKTNLGDHVSRGVYLEHEGESDRTIDIDLFGGDRHIGSVDSVEDNREYNFLNLEPNTEYEFEIRGLGASLDFRVVDGDFNTISNEGNMSNGSSYRTESVEFETDISGVAKIVFEFGSEQDYFTIDKDNTSLHRTGNDTEGWRAENITASMYDTFASVSQERADEIGISDDEYINDNNPYNIPDNLRLQYFQQGDEYTGADIMFFDDDGNELSIENDLSFNEGVSDFGRRTMEQLEDNRFRVFFEDLEGYRKFQSENPDLDPVEHFLFDYNQYNLQIGRGSDSGETEPVKEEDWLRYGREIQIRYQRYHTPPLEALYLDLSRTGTFNERTELPEDSYYDMYGSSIEREHDIANVIVERGTGELRGNIRDLDNRIITEFIRDGETYKFLAAIRDGEIISILTD